MTAQQIRTGIALLIAQVAILTMTLGFNSLLDRQAQADGIAQIITEAAR